MSWREPVFGDQTFFLLPVCKCSHWQTDAVASVRSSLENSLYTTMLHYWSATRDPTCCFKSSHFGLFWKVVLCAPLLLHLVLAQDEVHRHIVRFPNCHGLGNLTNRHIARIHILMKWGRSTKSIICRKLVWIEIFVLTHPKMPRKMLNCVNFLTRLLLNKQVGEMDNTDVPSDYTSNCLPPNCLPRWTWMKVIDNFNIWKEMMVSLPACKAEGQQGHHEPWTIFSSKPVARTHISENTS